MPAILHPDYELTQTTLAQVRVIVERLARRCGYDAVAAAMPAGDKRLLQHIRREVMRKQRLRASNGSQARTSIALPCLCRRTLTRADWTSSLDPPPAPLSRCATDPPFCKLTHACISCVWDCPPVNALVLDSSIIGHRRGRSSRTGARQPNAGPALCMTRQHKVMCVPALCVRRGMRARMGARGRRARRAPASGRTPRCSPTTRTAAAAATALRALRQPPARAAGALPAGGRLGTQDSRCAAQFPTLGFSGMQSSTAGTVQHLEAQAPITRWGRCLD